MTDRQFLRTAVILAVVLGVLIVAEFLWMAFE